MEATNKEAIELLRHWYQIEGGDEALKTLGNKGELGHLLKRTRECILAAKKQ